MLWFCLPVHAAVVTAEVDITGTPALMPGESVFVQADFKGFFRAINYVQIGVSFEGDLFDRNESFTYKFLNDEGRIDKEIDSTRNIP